MADGLDESSIIITLTQQVQKLCLLRRLDRIVRELVQVLTLRRFDRETTPIRS
jgi:hypothetical protein